MRSRGLLAVDQHGIRQSLSSGLEDEGFRTAFWGGAYVAPEPPGGTMHV
jgi:hypothetical protein